VADGQLPAPSHTAGFVCVLFEQLTSRQLVSEPGIVQVAEAPEQVPAHFPLPPHAGCPDLGAPETLPQVPGVLPLQYSQAPAQAVLQQTPSAQLLVMHAEADEQV